MPIRLTAALYLLLGASVAYAQRGPAPVSARDSAPIDLTGTWVSVVTEDWRHRMATSRVGDFESVPLNGNGRSAAADWNLEADNAAGLECKAFGVGGIIRQPGRMNISWQDDTTLRIDFDAGSQTRLLRFDGNFPEPEEKSWQGDSTALWQRPPGGRGGGAGAPRGGAGAVGSAEGVAAGGGGRGQRGGPPPSASISQGGSLEVRTTQFREGYLRKNGVPYSEDASITEHFHLLPSQQNGDEWLLVITIIEDPTYLSQPFYTSTQFKREPNDRNFNPTPCRTAPPPP
jgi:hypothetical protein